MFLSEKLAKEGKTDFKEGGKALALALLQRMNAPPCPAYLSECEFWPKRLKGGNVLQIKLCASSMCKKFSVTEYPAKMRFFWFCFSDTVHPACSVQKSPIFTILLFSFADRKEVKLQL